jgi:hypothetical protein
MSTETQNNKNIDACVIRTHAPEGNALAGHRVNHSAKAPKSGFGNNSRDWLDLGCMQETQIREYIYLQQSEPGGSNHRSARMTVLLKRNDDALEGKQPLLLWTREE